MSLVSQKKTGFAMFRLFEFISDLFQPVVARYGLFWIVLLFKSDESTKTFDLQIYNKSTSC